METDSVLCFQRVLVEVSDRVQGLEVQNQGVQGRVEERAQVRGLGLVVVALVAELVSLGLEETEMTKAAVVLVVVAVVLAKPAPVESALADPDPASLGMRASHLRALEVCFPSKPTRSAGGMS